MWINPNTNKGWTDGEEAIFMEIQSVSRLTRIQSIHLWKRFWKNSKRAVVVAKRDYPAFTSKQRANFQKQAERLQGARDKSMPHQRIWHSSAQCG